MSNQNIQGTRFSSAILEALQADDPAKRNCASTELLSSLENHFLPLAIAIAETTGKHIAFSHFTVGLILRLVSRPIEAESWFRRANNLQPGVLNTLQELVRCLGEQNRDSEALVFAKEAVATVPQDAGAWCNLAVALAHCGYRVESRKAIVKAVSLAPKDPAIRNVSEHFNDYFGDSELNRAEEQTH